jgi:hypothetical protein
MGHREIENIPEYLPDPSKPRTPISNQPHSEPASPVRILPTGWSILHRPIEQEGTDFQTRPKTEKAEMDIDEVQAAVLTGLGSQFTQFTLLGVRRRIRRSAV